jgi:hypothetical protein
MWANIREKWLKNGVNIDVGLTVYLRFNRYDVKKQSIVATTRCLGPC